ncbi:hemicentin-1-like [Agrilus planipennis]|uniref:Hemicentin-1-like n=1 Tax=Agrilus planipennis TaxID=224129 RepID=A0A1W4WET1_AGRPL|nr:hemicentin-1-like [Agrilus planipennis]
MFVGKRKMELVVLGTCLTLFFSGTVLGIIDGEPANAMHEVQTVQGNTASLPCDITPIVQGDKMHIVIWFKATSKGDTPIYTFDSRDKQLELGKHWSEESLLGKRAMFRYQDEPAKLLLENVKDSDAGMYHCRVDFQRSPTRNVRVNLSVIIPPEKLTILGENGSNIPYHILGPYNEGSSVNITCEVTGGRPLPKVTWWQENALLDDSFEYLPDRKVRNVLTIEKLARHHLHAVFVCQASNNNWRPLTSRITLDLNLRPLWVRFVGDNRPLSAGTPYELSCEVVGARPPPTITWWKGSVQMIDTRQTTSPDANTTTSVLTFTPTIDDDGKYLSCRGQQPLIQDSGIEDGWKLDIHYVPVVTLELGSNINSTNIREGEDVYFECNIKSNPWVYKVSWKHNGKLLYNNAAAGTIVSNQSLVLQAITRQRAGLYTCVGSNQEGDGESNPVQLNIKFAPVCRLGQPKVFGVARHELAKIPCDLEANPDKVNFTWKFNISGETIDIPQSHTIADKTRSIASYKPMTEKDYGTLLCKGTNEVGEQKEPCVFYITPAGKPDPLANCTILNQTADSLNVDCLEGFDGGLDQFFVMEVYDAQSRKLVSNVTSKSPIFAVGGLESGLGFEVALYAANKKGRSDVSRLHASTLKSAEKHTAMSPLLIHITPIIGTLAGVVVAIVLMAVIIVVVIRCRGRGEHDEKLHAEGSLLSGNGHHHRSGGRRGSVSNRGDQTSCEPLNRQLNCSVDSLDEKNPDLIPHENDEEYQEEERAFERLNNVQVRPFLSVTTGRSSPYGAFDPHTNVNEMTYAELSLCNRQNPHVIYNNQSTHLLNVKHKHEPVVYSQIQTTAAYPSQHQHQQQQSLLQPLSPPISASLPRLHHSGHMPMYVTRRFQDDLRGNVTPPQQQQQLQHEECTSSQTPLINPRINEMVPCSGPGLTKGTSIMSPRTVTTTRF